MVSTTLVMILKKLHLLELTFKKTAYQFNLLISTSDRRILLTDTDISNTDTNISVSVSLYRYWLEKS